VFENGLLAMKKREAGASRNEGTVIIIALERHL